MIAKLKSFLRKRLSQKSINSLHLLEAMYWAMRFGFPARGMVCIGITGTKGKTTSCHFMTSILEEAGYSVGMITTADFRINGVTQVNETNKSSLHPKYLQALLREMRDSHCNVAVIEVTSHALHQHRVWGVPFRYAGFTNLSHDHLDYHKTMEAYRAAKFRLFTHRSLKAIVINEDDETGKIFLEQSPIARKIGVSMSDGESTFATEHMKATKVSANSASSSFTLENSDEESVRVNLQLPGRFNVANALVATGIALAMNIRVGTIVAGLEKLERVPGRMERLETRKGTTIILDYAHTPDSLEQLYSTLRPDVRGRMIAILGATGDRDKTKRPIMGALAARFCDLVYVTDEEPYSEDPLRIIDEIADGVPRGRALFKESREQRLKREKPPVLRVKVNSENGEGIWWWKIPSRRDAIKEALSQGKLDDLIIITGMGSQTKRIVNGVAEPWNEREIIEEIMRELKLA